MAFTDLIKPGDKIDIRLLQQVENEERTGDTVKVYKSQVLDINKRGNLEISMPTEGTKLILLPLDVRLEFVFYSGGFLYKSIGQIVERFKRDNIYTLEVELKTRLEKFQRREFYRYECSIDFKFFELTEEQILQQWKRFLPNCAMNILMTRYVQVRSLTSAVEASALIQIRS